MTQMNLLPEEEPEGSMEVPNEWEVKQAFIGDQIGENTPDKYDSKDPTRYFKCYRCHRKVDRTKELMMQFSGGNQTFGLANILRDYCWGCYFIVKREAEGRLSGLTGREFALCVTGIKNGWEE